MLVSRRRFAALTAAGLAGIPGAPLAARIRPKLIVLLVAEQFRSDYLDLFFSYFGAGGFRRLMEEGAYYPECQMAATTFTSGGLATVATGAYPQLHGIVADAWYDRAAKKLASAGADELQATTLADQMGAADPANRTYALGLDSRHAALLGGRSPGAVFSMDSEGRFVSSPASVAWLSAFNQANSPNPYRNAAWPALGAKRGAPPLRTLAYDPAHPDDFLALYRSSPVGQAVQMALARELIVQEKLGQGPGADLLAIALGSAALLGYEVGADSPLMRELVIHFDHTIEMLLALLDKQLGPKNYAFVFTAAHGATRNPDRPAKSIPGEAVAKTINLALSSHYDRAGRKHLYIERYVYPFLYLRVNELHKAFIDVREARALAGQAALTVPGVAGYYTADGDCSHSGEWERRFRNSFHAVRSGDLMLAYAPGYVEDFGAGRGISYGSMYNYDSRVPLILFGLPFENEVFETAVESVDLAPTLARVAGTAWPSSATGRVLGEALVSAEG